MVDNLGYPELFWSPVSYILLVQDTYLMTCRPDSYNPKIGGDVVCLIHLARELLSFCCLHELIFFERC
jgi:hypothetical protein